MVTGGYEWLHGLQGSGRLRLVTGGYRWLRVVMGGHGWLWVVTGGYKWLRVVTGSHEWLRGLQGITGIMGGGRAVASRSFDQDLLNSMIH